MGNDEYIGQVKTRDVDTIETSDPMPREFTVRSSFVIAGTSICFFLSSGYLNAFGVFQDYYSLVLLKNNSPSQLSWLGSIALFTFFLGAPVVGTLTDKFGPTLPIAIGAVVQVFAMFMVSLCTEYYQFLLAQGVLLGFAMCFVAIPASGIAPRYFERHRGLATGITVSGSSVGGVIWPVIADQLLKQDKIGFPWTMRAMALMMIPLFVFAICTVREPLPPREELKNKERAGMTDDIPANESALPDAVQKPEKKKSDLSALRQRPFIFLAIGLFIMNLGFTPPLFYVTTYASNLNVAASLSFYFSSMANGASLFGRILPGWLSDRVGRFNTLIVSGLSAGIVVFLWTTAKTEGLLIAWALAYGFFSGAILSLLLATTSSLVPKESATTALGTLMGFVSIANLVASPIAGQLLTHGGYLAVSCFAAATLMAGAIFVTCSRLSLSRSLWAKV